MYVHTCANDSLVHAVIYNFICIFIFYGHSIHSQLSVCVRVRHMQYTVRGIGLGLGSRRVYPMVVLVSFCNGYME